MRFSSRIDLHPTNNEDSASRNDHIPTLDTRYAETDSENVENPNPDNTRRNRRSRILSTLNIGRMRHATPQERLEALRTLRNEHATNHDESARTRFSRRFSRALSLPVAEAHSRPVSGVPPAVSNGLPSMAETSPDQSRGDRSPPVDQRRQGTFAE